MKISVIIPILNEETNLLKLLPYLKDSSDSDIEIIVVDSHKSKDDSKRIAINNDVQYYSVRDCGRSKQMNYGAKKSSGDILLFVHADVLPPEAFDNLIKSEIEAGNEMGFFSYKFYPSTKWLEKNAKYTNRDGLFAGGGDQCQFFTKDCFQFLGGYNEKYVIMEDFAMIKSVRKHKKNYSIIQKHALVSSRKYKHNSYLKVNLVNFCTFIAFEIGVSPTTLKRVYKKVLKLS